MAKVFIGLGLLLLSASVYIFRPSSSVLTGRDLASTATETIKPTCPTPRLTSIEPLAFVQWLQTHASSLTSLDSFSDCLPDQFTKRDNFTFMIKSESPEAKDTSLKYPRAIFYAPGIFLSYSGDPKGPHYNEARLIVFHKEKIPSSFEFSTLQFSAQGAKLISERKNECARCHEGHPIWQAYREWKGTFGPESDLQWLTKNVDGYFNYLDFIRDSANSPRYGRWIQAPEGDQVKVSDADLIASRPEFQPRRPYAPSSNGLLEQIEIEHARWIHDHFRTANGYSKTKYLLAAIYLQCRIPDDIEAALEKKFVAAFGKSFADEFYSSRTTDDVYRKIHGVAMVGQLLGFSPELWSTEFTQGENRKTWNGPGMEFGGGRRLIDFTFRELLRDLIVEHPELAQAFPAERWKKVYYSMLDVRYHDRSPYQGFERECAGIVPLVQKEFDEARHQPFELLTGSYAPHRNISLQNQCLACHHPASTEGAPTIPFLNEKLPSWTSNDFVPYSGAAARSELMSVIQRGTMPKDRLLSPEEKAILIREVEGLRE